MLRRNAITQTTKSTPVITGTHAPTPCGSWFCRLMITRAPTTGPNTVPRPPSRVISTTSPDMCQCASDNEASWNTSVLVAPAVPESAADKVNTTTLKRSTS